MFFTFEQFEAIQKFFKFECPICHDDIQLMWIENQQDEPELILWFCPICFARFALTIGMKMTEAGLTVDKR